MVNFTETELALPSLGLTDDDAIAIGEALKRNNALFEVDLRKFYINQADNNKITEKGANAIANALETSTGITSLNFAWGNTIRDGGIASLTNALRTNTSLAKLKLSNLQTYI